MSPQVFYGIMENSYRPARALGEPEELSLEASVIQAYVKMVWIGTRTDFQKVIDETNFTKINDSLKALLNEKRLVSYIHPHIPKGVLIPGGKELTLRTEYFFPS